MKTLFLTLYFYTGYVALTAQLSATEVSLHNADVRAGITQMSVVSSDSLEWQIDLLHRRKFSWLISKNIDSLAVILHPRLLYVHSNGWTETREEVLENIRTEKLRYIHVDISEVTVRVEGNCGIVTGKGTFTVSLDGTPLSIQLYYTEVYVITNKNIYLFSRHACKL